VFAWGYYEGVAATEGRLRLARIGDLALLATPTDGGLYLAGACPLQEARAEFLADRERGLAEGVATWPELASLLTGARRVGPVRVVANWQGFLRQAAGPGWALLGDAGHFKDPTPAQGIADALRQAERLAAAVGAGLDDERGLDAALERWWRWRDRDASEMYRFASDMGMSISPIVSHEVLGGVAADPEATAQFLQVLNHDLAPAELFTVGRIARAIGGAVWRRPWKIPAIAAELGREIASELRHSGRLLGSRLLTPPVAGFSRRGWRLSRARPG
jgi:2-polyprenyl-6-methoxyphenol hydroxylase-like FAD-dependent oxidoreductase